MKDADCGIGMIIWRTADDGALAHNHDDFLEVSS